MESHKTDFGDGKFRASVIKKRNRRRVALVLTFSACFFASAFLFAQYKNTDEILNAAFDSTNGALRINAVASGGGGGPAASFLGADQIFNKIFDSANTALKVNCVAGCGGSGSGTVNSGTVNQIGYYATTGSSISGDPNLADNGTTLSYTGTGGIASGTNPATTGAFNMPNSASLSARNAANTGDVPLIEADASDHIVLGNFNASTVQLGGANFTLDVGTTNAAKMIFANTGSTISQAGSSSRLQFGATSPNDIEAYLSSGGNFVVGGGGIEVGGETATHLTHTVWTTFLPGALTSTWTGNTLTLDQAITVTRIQVQVKTAPATCTTNAVVELTDGTTSQDVTLVAATNDSGPIAQNYAAAAVLTVGVKTAATGCATSPADANVTVQYKMQ